MPNDVSCPDCGQDPVHHQSQWFLALFDSIFNPAISTLDNAVGKVKPTLFKYAPDRAALPVFRLFAALRLGTLTSDVDEFDSLRNKFVWESAKKRGIVLYQFRLFGKPDITTFFVAKYDGKTFAFEGLPRPDRGHSKSIGWMDNKSVLKKKFLAAGIPMAQGRACRTFTQALKTMNDVGTPVIAKPHIGSRSRHTSINITTPEQLKVAFRKANQLSPWVIIEQQLQGDVFRILLVQGKMVAVARREMPHVVGDGVSTIRQLVELENKNPGRNGPTFHRLPTGDEVLEELARKNMDWDSIPAKKAVVIIDTHVSRYYGASTTDFTDRVHPENIKLFEHIGTVLDDSLVGVDFIIEDMERSWKEQKLCGVIECNSLPNVDLHHEVLYGENRDMAGLLFDIVFSR